MAEKVKDDGFCAFCQTYANSTSPSNCSTKEQARKCGWNVSAWNKPARKIGKIEGPSVDE